MKKFYTSKFFSIIASVDDTADKHSFAIISKHFWKKFETIPMGYSGARGALIYEKKPESEISCQTPFKQNTYSARSQPSFISFPRLASHSQLVAGHL
jgi:hypothetical protein